MFNVAIIGQGYVGLPLAIYAAQAGNKVIGFDIDKQKILDILQGLVNTPDLSQNLLRNLIQNKNYQPTADIKEISNSDIIVLAVPTPLKIDGTPDTSFLESAAQLVSENCKSTALIVNESTSYPGTLRNLVKPIFNKKSLDKLTFASAPERVDPGNFKWNLENTPRVVSGLTSNATEKTVEFYRTFCREVKVVSSPEVAEASKLFENTFRMVNIALANEFAEISEKLGFSAYEAIDAASTKPFGFMAFYPSVGVGGHCIPIDPKYLSHVARLAGADSSLIDKAHEINSYMPSKLAVRIKNEFDGTLNNRKIQIAGIAYKPNVPDLRESPGIELLHELRDLGAVVTWHDPVVKELNQEKSSDLDINIDLGLIVTPHKIMNLLPWKESEVKVLDLSVSPENLGWPKYF
jgi:UDP-N-acetyl-D-glucosamine dehydrogenase